MGEAGEHLSVSQVKLVDTTCAWLAGLIDAEGCICVVRVTPPSYECKTNRYRVLVEITNTDQRLIDALKLKTGLGQIVHRKSPNERCKESWKWIARADACRAILTAVRPWLVCKGRQADVALEVLDIKRTGRTGRHGGYSPEAARRMAACKTQMNELNRRGVAA